jgi:hypothetical protein
LMFTEWTKVKSLKVLYLKTLTKGVLYP